MVSGQAEALTHPVRRVADGLAGLHEVGEQAAIEIHSCDQVVGPRVGARVPVVQGVADQPSVAVEQAVVDRPRVDPDRVEPAGGGAASGGGSDTVNGGTRC